MKSLQSLQLKRLQRKIKRKENKIINNKFNFGKDANGFILTSTSSKVHTYNTVIRKSNELRDKNFKRMLEAFERGEISTKVKRKISKGCRRNLYIQSIKNANDTKAFIKKICKFLSKDSKGRTISILISKI